MKLGVNIDHCATLRQARYCDVDVNSGIIIEPDIVEMARLAESGGADSLTMHLREDRRHIQDADILRVKEIMQTKLNMEMACTKEMVTKALEFKPDYVCIVPENRMEVTTEGGLDIISKFSEVEYATKTLQDAGIIVSLFIDPALEQIKRARQTGATHIELHTGAFANSWGDELELEKECARIRKASILAKELYLTTNAGHGLNYINIKKFLSIAEFNELNIGHSIVSKALTVGMKMAVMQMRSLIDV